MQFSLYFSFQSIFLTKILLNVTEEVFPCVTLLPSGGDCTKISIPNIALEMVKVPKDKPLEIFIDSKIA